MPQTGNTTSVSNPLGVEALTIEIPAHVVYDFQKLYNWKFRGIPEKQRPMTLAGFIQTQVTDDGRAHAKYAEDSAYRMVEKLVFDRAKISGISPQEAAQALGVQLREK